VFPGVATRFVGGVGTSKGLMPESVLDSELSPIALTASSLTEYVRELLRPVIVIGLLVSAGDKGVNELHVFVDELNNEYL
jgi:hypothetical protein